MDGSNKRAKIRSILIPENSNLMIGTNASGTGVIFSIAPGGDIRSRIGGKSEKKSSIMTCLGATIKVSISDPTNIRISCFFFSRCHIPCTYLDHRHLDDNYHT